MTSEWVGIEKERRRIHVVVRIRRRDDDDDIYRCQTLTCVGHWIYLQFKVLVLFRL